MLRHYATSTGNIHQAQSEAVPNPFELTGGRKAPLEDYLSTSLESKSGIRNASIYGKSFLNDKRMTLDEYLHGQIKAEEGQDLAEAPNLDGQRRVQELGPASGLVQTLAGGMPRKVLLKEGAKNYKHSDRDTRNRKGEGLAYESAGSYALASYSDVPLLQSRTDSRAELRAGGFNVHRESPQTQVLSGITSGDQSAKNGASQGSTPFREPESKSRQQRLGPAVAGATAGRQAVNLQKAQDWGRPQTQVHASNSGS